MHWMLDVSGGPMAEGTSGSCGAQQPALQTDCKNHFLKHALLQDFLPMQRNATPINRSKLRAVKEKRKSWQNFCFFNTWGESWDPGNLKRHYGGNVRVLFQQKFYSQKSRLMLKGQSATYHLHASCTSLFVTVSSTEPLPFCPFYIIPIF